MESTDSSLNRSSSTTLYKGGDGMLDFKAHWFTWITVGLLFVWFGIGIFGDKSWGQENGFLGKLQLLELFTGGWVALGAGKAYRCNSKMRRFWFWIVAVWIYAFTFELCWDWGLFPSWNDPIYGFFYLLFFFVSGFIIVRGLIQNFDRSKIFRCLQLPVYDLAILLFAIGLSLLFRIEGLFPVTTSLFWGEFGETLIWWIAGTIVFQNSVPPLLIKPQRDEEFIEYKKHFEKKGITNIVRLKNGGGSGCSFCTGYVGNEKVFIKWGGTRSERKAEFHAIQLLHNNNPDQFTKPYFGDSTDHVYCVCEFLYGEPLDFLLKTNKLSTERKQKVLRQLKEIAKTLLETKIVSRDCGLHNLFLTENDRLVLVDFDRAVDTNNCSDWDIMEYQLRRSGAIVGWLEYDDFPELLSVVKKIGKLPENADVYNEVYDYIKTHIGKLRVETSFVIMLSITGLLFFLKKRITYILAGFIPLKRWRNRFRGGVKKQVSEHFLFIRQYFRDDVISPHEQNSKRDS